MVFPYKAVLFDWAYTLADLGGEDDRRPFQKMVEHLREMDVPLPEFEELFGAYRTLFYELIEQSRKTHQEACFENVLKYLLLRYSIAIEGKTTVRDLLKLYYEEMYKDRQLYPDTVSTLQELQGSGVRLGIVSNTTNPGFMKDYERELTGLDPYFEFALYSSELPYRKPHPSIYRLAIERLGIPEKDILFVGDNLKVDIAGAQAVGLPALWINREGAESGNPVTPDYEVHSLSEILTIGSIKV
ncbi:MAG: HAD family hydrolase [Nitrospinaceae bacterium]